MERSSSREIYLSLLQKEQNLANELEKILLDFGEGDTAITTLRQVVLNSLDEGLFLLVVVGEYNAGKSTCINAMLREKLLEEGNLPTTKAITKIRRSEKRSTVLQADGILLKDSDAEILEHFSIIDTPGVNSVIREDQRLTNDFVPRSDFVLFVISAVQPFSQSQCEFLETIRSWNKPIVIVLNKIDLLKTPLDQTVDFVRKNCSEQLHFVPEIFPVSALKTLDLVKASGSEVIRIWKDNGFNALEAYIQHTLDDKERLRIKLLTLLGTIEGLLTQVKPFVEQRVQALDDYYHITLSIDKQFEQYRKDIAQDISLCLSKVGNIVLEMQVRGVSFFDEEMKLGNIFLLFKRKQVRERFKLEVIKDSVKLIAQEEQNLAERLEEKEKRLRRNVSEALDTLRELKKLPDKLLEEYEQKFRKEIMESLDRLSSMGNQQDTVNKEIADNQKEIGTIVQDTTSDLIDVKDYVDAATTHLKEFRDATTGTAVGGAASGIGLGAAAIFSGAVAVEIGVLLSVALLGFGVYNITKKKSGAKQDFEEKVRIWREKRDNSLEMQNTKEFTKIISQMQNVTKNYVTRIQIEQEKTKSTYQSLFQLTEDVMKLRKEFEPPIL